MVEDYGEQRAYTIVNHIFPSALKYYTNIILKTIKSTAGARRRRIAKFVIYFVFDAFAQVVNTFSSKSVKFVEIYFISLKKCNPFPVGE